MDTGDLTGIVDNPDGAIRAYFLPRLLTIGLENRQGKILSGMVKVQARNHVTVY